MAKPTDASDLIDRINKSTRQVRGDTNRGHDSLLFLNTQYESFPVMLQQESLISSNAKAVYNNLWIWAKSQQTGSIPATLFPDYEYLMNATGLEKGTVASSIYQLRLQRYLTLHQQVHNDQGHFVGNDYILNDEPMNMGDTLLIDKSFVDFVIKQFNHRHLRVQKLANLVKMSIDAHITETDNPFQPSTQSQVIQSRQQATRINQARLFPKDHPLEEAPSHYWGIPYDEYLQAIDRVHKVNSVDFDDEEPQVHKVNSGSMRTDDQVHKVNSGEKQVENSGRVHKVNSGQNEDGGNRVHFVNTEVNSCSSRGFINKTTTTTGKPQFTKETTSIESLAYPPFETPNELAICKLHIMKLDAEYRQPILDELAARMENIQKPLENPIGYLKGWLIKSLEQGEIPFTSLGAQYAARRENPQPRRTRQQELDLRNQGREVQSEINNLKRLIGFHERANTPKEAWSGLLDQLHDKELELEQFKSSGTG